MNSTHYLKTLFQIDNNFDVAGEPDLADVPVHCFRDPVRHHAAHQHFPVQCHDLQLHQDRGHREGAKHLRRLLRLRLTVRVRNIYNT